MTNIHDHLAAIQRQGASSYAETTLADSHRPVARRVRRDRAVRGSVATLAGVGVLGAGTFGALQLRGADALAPASGSSPTAGLTDDEREELREEIERTQADVVQERHEKEAAAAAQVDVKAGQRADIIIHRVATEFAVSHERAREAIVAALPAEANGSVEGWLAVGEYGSAPDVEAFASTLVDNQVATLQGAGVEPADWHEVLTLASLVEKESPQVSDMPRVARVILNRLDGDMRLELDSTVRYSLGADQSETFLSDAERATDSAYNTYVSPGLPPGPIASPSRHAIEAVLAPAKGDWLYFVTVNPDTGETKFAVGFEEHMDNVLELQEWAKATHPDAATDGEG